MFGRRKQRFQVEVQEGRLSESPTRDAQGVDRRAFGEFVGPRGELASYAFGWVSNADPREARLSVGIGHGNPGGGTFHASVFLHDGERAFALVDEPFETVPQGGPHLIASDARGHVDLPFVWAVVDTVMERDRRAAWMGHWLRGTIAIVTGEVAAGREPVLLIAHDDDGMWQLIGTTDADPATGKVEHLHHHIDGDPTLLDAINLVPEERATRSHLGAPWTRHRRIADH